MSILFAQNIAELRTRIERLEALEVPEQVSDAAHVAYLAVGGGDYGLLRIDENGDETLLNSGLPAGCSVVGIAVSPIDTDRIAVLVNFPDNPYPLFAIQGGVVIRGDPANGYPTNGGPCLYVADDGATFTAVTLPTSNGNSAGRVAMGINGLEWSGTTLVIVGAVEYFWDGVVTANNVLWRWSSGASATIQFETTGAMSVPFKTIVGQDEDAITLEMINPFASSSERIAYATDVAANWTVQHTGTALGIYAGADLLPDSRSLVAGYDSGNIVLLADYRVAGAPSVISTTALRATIAPFGGFPDFALAFWLSAATHGVYYIDASDHLQKISDPTGTPTTTQVSTDQIPNAAVIGFVRAARQNRQAVAAVDPTNAFVYITTDGSSWAATEVTSYTLAGPVDVVDVGGGTYPSPHALSGDRHFGTLSSSQHSNQPGGALHDEATTSVAGFLSAADKTTITNLVSITYITQTPSSTLTAEQALSLLSSGYAKITTGTGVISTVAAIPTTDLSGEISDAQHGDRAGGSLHALATTLLAGFLSAADKQLIDDLGTTYVPLAGTTAMAEEVPFGSPSMYIMFSPVGWSGIYLSNDTTIDGQLSGEAGATFAGDLFADNISATPTPDYIPKADGTGKLVVGWIPDLPANIITSGTIGAVRGGTGFSSYTIGDLLQASATNTLARLAAVATGNALISGGVGTVSSWGKIGLTTHISGVLAAPNGGTDQSSYTVGDLLYASTTTALSKLAAAAVGNVLRAKGTGTAPAWEQVVLTTDVTGVLPYANGGSTDGTWTPIFLGSGTAGTFTYSGTNGSYTRNGNLVTCHGRLTITAITVAPTTNLLIGGLPFTVNNATLANWTGSVSFQSGFTIPAGGSGYISIEAIGGGTTCSLRYNTAAGGYANFPAANLGAAATIIFMVSYRV